LGHPGGVVDQERDHRQPVNDPTIGRRSAYIFASQITWRVLSYLSRTRRCTSSRKRPVEFWSYAAPGIGIGNHVALFQRIDFPLLVINMLGIAKDQPGRP